MEICNEFRLGNKRIHWETRLMTVGTNLRMECFLGRAKEHAIIIKTFFYHHHRNHFIQHFRPHRRLSVADFRVPLAIPSSAFAFCSLLFIVLHSLYAVLWSPFAVRSWTFPPKQSLLTIRSSLFAASCSPLAVCYSPFADRCSPFAAFAVIRIIQCDAFTHASTLFALH